MINSFSRIAIVLSLLLFPSYSLSQIYKWTDERGTIHFAEDPSKISRENLSDQEEFNQSPPSVLSDYWSFLESL